MCVTYDFKLGCEVTSLYILLTGYLFSPPQLCTSTWNIPDIPIPDDMLPKSLSAPQTGYTVLKPFLQQQGREPDRVLGDGNCLFRAPSWALTGVEDHHTDLRRTIIEFYI